MKRQTSWQPVNKWYKDITRDKGHYYHQHVVIPGLLKLLRLHQHDSLLDLACGTGVLARAIPKDVPYAGIDIAKGLIEEAKKQDKNSKHTYTIGDITKPLNLPAQEFSHATCVLALQNVEHFQGVFQNAAKYLQKDGVFIIVINHPMFRIPRQTSWGIDDQSKLQYRKINRYLSPLSIPITAHPGNEKKSPVTWSFHQPLSTYINGLHEAGFSLTQMEEWSSDKESEGKMKKMEDRARNEIPLFMTLVAEKK